VDSLLKISIPNSTFTNFYVVLPKKGTGAKRHPTRNVLFLPGIFFFQSTRFYSLQQVSFS
jgi:hypothetical protein